MSAPTATEMRRTRARTLVYLAVLAEPGASISNIARTTRLNRVHVVRSAVRDLELSGLVTIQYTALNGGECRVYAIPQPDPTAKRTLTNLLPTMQRSRADILAEA